LLVQNDDLFDGKARADRAQLLQHLRSMN